jgi:GT2 family glycosyltransferase
MKLDYPFYKVVVVDNSEDESSKNMFLNWAEHGTPNIKTDFPNLTTPYVSKPVSISLHDETDDIVTFASAVTLISARNRGFAAANNLAMSKSAAQQFKFFWLLNNDTVVAQDALSNQVAYMETQPKIGILGSKLLHYFQPEIIQGVGGFYNKWFGKVTEIGAGEKDLNQWDHAQFTMDYVIGASMLVRQQFVKTVGFMNEHFFLYYEELEWALRGKKFGWSLGFCKDSIVYHKMGASINKGIQGNSELADFYSVRNRILITKKFFPIALITLYPAFIKFIFNRVRLGQFSRIVTMFKIMFNPNKDHKSHNLLF